MWCLSKVNFKLLSETYEEARLKLKKAEETSELETDINDVEASRARRKKQTSPPPDEEPAMPPPPKVRKQAAAVRSLSALPAPPWALKPSVALTSGTVDLINTVKSRIGWLDHFAFKKLAILEDRIVVGTKTWKEWHGFYDLLNTADVIHLDFDEM